MILLLSSPLHITLEEPLICDVAGTQNRVFWVLKITWLGFMAFSLVFEYVFVQSLTAPFCTLYFENSLNNGKK